MNPPVATPNPTELLDTETIGFGPPKMEDLVDRDALREMLESFQQLFAVPLRIITASGSLLAAGNPDTPIYQYISQNTAGRQAYHELVTLVRDRTIAARQPTLIPCFTGASYRAVPIEYDSRVIGRIVLGPYLTERPSSLPDSLIKAAPEAERDRALSELQKMIVITPDRAEAMTDHMAAALDVILFSGHKALMTSTMHLASVQESYREVTQKKEELEEAYERLQELDRLKSNFLATISHELRTPLTSIIGYSEMLAEGLGGPLTQDQLDFVQTIRTKGDQLLGLIMSLLDLSKLESGTMLMRRSDVSLKSVLAEAMSTVAPAAAKKGVVLKIEIQDDVPQIRADPDRLRQVFINLADNAIKFTPPDGTVTLGARLEEEEDEDDDLGAALVLVAPLRRIVRAFVADTGPGIAEHERMRVFDPFYQVDQSSTREQGGTGLGLSIVKRILEAHQGRVRVDQNQPTGAVFVVDLPISAASIPPSRPPSRPPSIPPQKR